MKKIFLLSLLFFSAVINAQSIKKQVVEASCGQCQFGIKSIKGCDLAVRIDHKAYFIDGAKIDDHGDAHAKDGFCSAIRQAEVTGEIVNNRFVATSFKLLPTAIKQK